MCTQPALGDKMVVPAVYRDFRAKMPTDFEPGATGRMTALTGMVQADAGRGGQARLRGNVANSYVTSAATFAQWYRDTAEREPHDRRQADALEQRPGAAT